MNSDPTGFSAEEQYESLAQAIHEGDWMMVSEWRWNRASATEREVSRRRARAVLDAYDSGVRDAEGFAAVIASVGWTVTTGSPGRLRAKADKVVQWFAFRDKGYLLNR